MRSTVSTALATSESASNQHMWEVASEASLEYKKVPAVMAITTALAAYEVEPGELKDLKPRIIKGLSEAVKQALADDTCVQDFVSPWRRLLLMIASRLTGHERLDGPGSGKLPIEMALCTTAFATHLKGSLASGPQAASEVEHLVTSGHEFQKLAKKAQAAATKPEEGQGKASPTRALTEDFENDALETMSTVFPPIWDRALQHLSQTGAALLGAEKVRIKKMFGEIEKSIGGMPSKLYSDKKKVWTAGLKTATMDAALKQSQGTLFDKEFDGKAMVKSAEDMKRVADHNNCM